MLWYKSLSACKTPSPKVDLVDRFQEKMKHNKSITKRKQKRAGESEVHPGEVDGPEH